MDERRLNTSDLLAMGILDTPAPATDCPTDRERFDAQSESSWSYAGSEAVIAALAAGQLVSASNYYGIPALWRAAEGVYRGQLLQYRSLTEDRTFPTAAEAEEWFRETYHRTDG